MTLKEQLEKVEQEMKKNEEKRKDLLEKRKKLLGEIELETARNEAEKNRKVMDVITESFGEVTEENLELFRRIMREQIYGSNGKTKRANIPGRNDREIVRSVVIR